jgi:transcriptional regulator with XRE-family HTH domain
LDSIQKIAKRMFGKKIQIRRIAVGFSTQEQLAEALGVDQARVSRWENGTNFPSKEYWPSLVKILKLKEEHFIEAPTQTQNPEEQAYLSKLRGQIDEMIKQNVKNHDLETENAQLKAQLQRLTQELINMGLPKKNLIRIKKPKRA